MNRNAHKTTPSSSLTLPQILILMLVIGLLLVILGLVAFALLRQPTLQGGAAGGVAPIASPSPRAPENTLQPFDTQPASLETLPVADPPLSPPTTEPTLPQSETVPPPPAACAPTNTEIRLGTVINVLDGDTIEVEVDGSRVTVGYAGVDAPALDGGRLASQALNKNQELVSGQLVVLVKDVSESDPNGRLLRYVFLGDRFINYELVRLGYAAAIDSLDQACTAVLRQAESEARGEQRVIWAPTPIPTATFLPTVGFDPKTPAACDCSVRWECSDFRTHAGAQACFNACNDYNSRLDEDHDGLACEDLP